jgi:hypothetical protein
MDVDVTDKWAVLHYRIYIHAQVSWHRHIVTCVVRTGSSMLGKASSAMLSMFTVMDHCTHPVQNLFKFIAATFKGMVVW